MRRSITRFVVGLALVAPLNVRAEDEAPDAAAGAVDPYDAGGERGRFLAAAGVDSELDEKEFKANLSATDPFVRKFDSWASLKAFDKNNNNSIDWFEAEGYRRAVRDAVLLAYDKDKDNRLTEEERTAANRQLAAGKTPRITLPGRASGGTTYDPVEWDLNGDGKFDDEEREVYNKKNKERWAKQQEEYTKKWDADGDGKLSPDEYKAASDAAIKEWREKNPEQAAQYDKQQEQWKKQQEEYTKKWDTDGDGKLSKEEQKIAWDHQAEEGRKQYAEYIKKWDADGDGKLNADEQKAASDSYMKDWREKNPEAAAQYDKQMADWKKQQEEYVRDFDADRDGKLSAEEWQEVYKAQREKAKKDGGGAFPGGGGFQPQPGAGGFRRFGG